MSQTLVVPLQGRFPALLDATPAATGWIMTSSLLVGAVAMPVSGRMADLLGKRRVLLVSAVLLVVGSVVCACSRDLWTMILGRGVQGLSMGFIPVGIATVRDVRPPALVPAGVGAVSATLGLGGGLGLPLSAWVAQSFDWRSLFWCSAALGLLVAGAVFAGLPKPAQMHRRVRVDTLGALGLAAGVAMILTGVTRAPTRSWLDLSVLALVGAGVVVLLLWGIYEVRTPEPLCDLRTARTRPVLLTNLTAMCLGFSMMMQVVAVPQLMQLPAGDGNGLGLNLIQTGLYLMPACLVMSACAPLAGSAIRFLDHRVVLGVGAGLVGLGHLVTMQWGAGPWVMVAGGCVLYAGVGIAYAAMPTIVMASVDPRDTGASLGLNSLVRSVGSTVASAVAATLLAGLITAAGTPAAEAFRACFGAGLAAAMLAVVLAAFIPTRPRVAEQNVRSVAAAPTV